MIFPIQKISTIKRIQLVAFILSVMLSACGPRTEQETSEAFEKAPAQTEVRYAKAFNLTYFEGFEMLSIYNSTEEPRDTVQFVLLSKGVSEESMPQLPEGLPIIRTPISSLALTSTTQVGLCVFMEAQSVIAGMAGARFVFDEQVRQAVEKGEIMDLGSDVTLNQEVFMQLNPEVVMLSTMGDLSFGKYAALQEMGMVLLPNVEWLDQHPLGRAEWVKVLAALLEQEEKANERFSEVETEYLRLKQLIESEKQRPLVLTGSPYKGEWYVPGRQSFKGQLLSDAGASWPWENENSAVSLPISFEVVYNKGLKADYWIEPGNAGTLEEILLSDTRYADFKSVRTGQVFNGSKRKVADGLGFDLWESAVARPDLVLADLVHIFHPQKLPDHTLYYFEKLK